MKKTEAVTLLGGNITKTAELLGVSRYTVHRWPDELTISVSDQVRGCYARITEERDREVKVILSCDRK